MADVLRDGNFSNIKAQTPILPLHDRPISYFQPIPDEKARREVLSSLTKEDNNTQVLVSSTSWTPDEDFSLLIDALCKYSAATTCKINNKKLPQILAIITGKGPQKEKYMQEIARLEKAGKLHNVSIQTTWLSFPVYARLLASASLGVSLHTSSSGVDLPMKVVDMFGAGLPVVGWNRFQSWPELVTQDVDGMGFGDSDELAAILVDLFGHPAKLERLRLGAQRQSFRRWDDEWDPVAGRLLGLI